MSHPVTPPLSLILVKNAVLDPRHLDFVIDALNHQTDSRFNTFWIDQNPDPAPLKAQLESARFGWKILHTPGQVIAGVACWDLIPAFAALMQFPGIGRYFSYLHMECLPETHFVATILQTLPEIESAFGPAFICMLQQLWCPLKLHDLDPRHYLEQIRCLDLYTWPEREAFHPALRVGPAYLETPWQENAFLMPTALARELKLYSAVQSPLYFQDVFDIFLALGERPYGRRIRWIWMQEAIIYHLEHWRAFLEFRSEFLAAVLAHPEIFGHLSLYQAAASGLSYLETDAPRDTVAHELVYFYAHARFGERGSVSLWLKELDQAHGCYSGENATIRKWHRRLAEASGKE
ncbi:MAG: hypothetical protein ACAI44_14225 [Candidatus Sericytochromatia bacterium]